MCGARICCKANAACARASRRWARQRLPFVQGRPAAASLARVSRPLLDRVFCCASRLRSASAWQDAGGPSQRSSGYPGRRAGPEETWAEASCRANPTVSRYAACRGARYLAELDDIDIPSGPRAGCQRAGGCARGHGIRQDIWLRCGREGQRPRRAGLFFVRGWLYGRTGTQGPEERPAGHAKGSLSRRRGHRGLMRIADVVPVASTRRSLWTLRSSTPRAAGSTRFIEHTPHMQCWDGHGLEPLTASRRARCRGLAAVHNHGPPRRTRHDPSPGARRVASQARRWHLHG